MHGSLGEEHAVIRILERVAIRTGNPIEEERRRN
jgi:hypothetical protein